MKPRSLTFPLLIYVALEFSNPLMPGAVNFNPDESVEGIHHPAKGGLRLAPDAVAPWWPRHLALDEFRASTRPVTRPVGVRFDHASGLRAIDPRSADPPPPSEDH